MANESQPLIGIDLGTTNSVVAHIDAHGRPTSLRNSEGDLLTPSVVYFEDEGPAIVGREAIKAGLLDPARMADAVKRDMGKETYHRPVNGRQLPPAAISGVILHRLIEDAAQQVGAFDRAIVTVPAYFNEPRRKATMDAARMAGLKEVELLNEPTAAALAFGYEMGVFTGDGRIAGIETKTAGEVTILVYDLGGGTFDVTLMRIKERHFRALVCDGDVQLGGRDWDQRIVSYAVECFERELGLDVSDDAVTLGRIWAEAEDLKRSLSQRQRGVLRLESQGKRLSIELTREDLLQLTAELLGRTRLTCELAMMDGRLGWERLDGILLVGGASRMPMVHDMLQELSGQPANRSVSPDEAVAHGAALYAQMLWGQEPSGKLRQDVRKMERPRITDVNSHSLGIVGRDRKTNERRVSILIPKNTAIPHSNSKVYRTRYPNQRKIYIQVVEGESDEPAECALVGECRLEDLPAQLPSDWPVTITFAYRRDGRIFVEAQVRGQEPFQVEIDRKQKISDTEAEAWASQLIGEIMLDEEDEPTLAEPAPRPPAARDEQEDDDDIIILEDDE